MGSFSLKENMPIGNKHHAHHHHHHHAHLHTNANTVGVMQLLKEHRSDTQWRLDQHVRELGDSHAAHELEHLAHERLVVIKTAQRVSLQRTNHRKKKQQQQQQQDSSPNRADSPTPKAYQRKGRKSRRSSAAASSIQVKPQNLNSVDLFRGLSEKQKQQLCDHCIIRPQPKNAKIIVQGEPGNKMFILLKGQVSVQIQDTEVATLYPISVFGERALMLGGGASASCVAVEPCILGSLSREAFNNAIGHELAQELEDFTRLRSIVQDSKNEQNYKVAHQSDQEKLMMKSMAMFRKTMRAKLGRMRAIHAKKHARAQYHWRLAKDFSMAIVLAHFPCMDDLTSRHYSILGRKILHTIKRHKTGDALYVKGDSSTGIYLLLRGTVR